MFPERLSMEGYALERVPSRVECNCVRALSISWAACDGLGLRLTMKDDERWVDSRDAAGGMSFCL